MKDNHLPDFSPKWSAFWVNLACSIYPGCLGCLHFSSRNCCWYFQFWRLRFLFRGENNFFI